MKTINQLTIWAILLMGATALTAQEKDLIVNGSFENTNGPISSYGGITIADSISSSNNTTVDLFGKNACGNYLGAPDNYMGTQGPKTGGNYAGFTAYYSDDAGIFISEPGYRQYSEYIQFAFSEPLTAGRSYSITFNVSLAEKSAYAVSGLGAYISTTKMDVKNNAFLPITPHIACTEVVTNTEWTTISSTYVAAGGERYLTIGCFDSYMEIQKIIAPFTTNSRKAYYYIDDVSFTPVIIPADDIATILSGSCYQLNDLNFETDRSVILSASYPELLKLSLFLKKYPSIMVYIDGHTDITGTNVHNYKLSERADAVKDYLVKEGVDIKRMKTRGHGEDQPIDMVNSNSSTNRRVEITICAILTK
jgi:OOP family OmpA-OmpF porin